LSKTKISLVCTRLLTGYLSTVHQVLASIVEEHRQATVTASKSRHSKNALLTGLKDDQSKTRLFSDLSFYSWAI